MNIARYIKSDLIKLQMESVFDPPEEDGYTKKQQLSMKEAVLSELVKIMDNTSMVSNPKKLLLDMVNREKKASTAIGNGVAIPHIRSMQAKELIMVIGRNRDGYDFDSMDGQPVKLFFCMAAPPYEDSLYLKIFRELAIRFEHPGFIESLLEAENEHEIIYTFKEFEQG